MNAESEKPPGGTVLLDPDTAQSFVGKETWDAVHEVYLIEKRPKRRRTGAGGRSAQESAHLPGEGLHRGKLVRLTAWRAVGADILAGFERGELVIWGRVGGLPTGPWRRLEVGETSGAELLIGGLSSVIRWKRPGDGEVVATLGYIRVAKSKGAVTAQESRTRIDLCCLFLETEIPEGPERPHRKKPEYFPEAQKKRGLEDLTWPEFNTAWRETAKKNRPGMNKRGAHPAKRA